MLGPATWEQAFLDFIWVTLFQKIKILWLLSEATTSTDPNVFTFVVHSSEECVGKARERTNILHQDRFSLQIPLLIVPLPLAWVVLNDFPNTHWKSGEGLQIILLRKKYSTLSQL
jgi:hypothetical protein